MDINNIIQNSTDALSTGGTISFGAIFLALSVSLVCGMFIAYIYRTQYQGVLFHQTHATAIVLITLVTTMVIMVISGNIVLSLGMVGALSIVRFRGAIKDPLDIVYLFWAVGIGIANGVAYFSVSIVSCIFIGITLIFLKRNINEMQSKLLVLNCKTIDTKDVFNFIESMPGKANLRSRSDDADQTELVFELITKDHFSSIDELKSLDGVLKVRLLNYSANN
tara:strand:+ start:107 stop:772 length:666 start_codon:yes stop_codon:yes gene_type:complete